MPVPSVSNAERSAATREKLLEAAITAIVRYGYAGATSVRIAEISGLTRGAQVHHFGTKAKLMVEALLHLHSRRLKFYSQPDAVDSEDWDPLTRWVETTWQSFDDDTWIAAAEMWTAARTDAELREALVEAERIIARRLYAVSTINPLFEGIPEERVMAMTGAVYAAMRGMVMHEFFDRSKTRAKAQRAELTSALRLWLVAVRSFGSGSLPS